MSKGINNDNELIVNKRTDLLKIFNKDKYTKLILNCNVRPFNLRGLKNIKELIINGKKDELNNINEVNLSEYPFNNSLEILRINNVKRLGSIHPHNMSNKKYEFTYYQHLLPNLKIIEIPSSINTIDNMYLKSLFSLEEIILNVKDCDYYNNSTNVMSTIYLPETIKNIFLKKEHKIYKIDLPYKINSLSGYGYDDKKHNIFLYCSNDIIRSTVSITKSVETKNRLVVLTNKLIDEKNILHIPDFITSINRESNKITFKVKGLSINSSLLSTQINVTKDPSIEQILSKEESIYLEKIIIRNNNEMSLFQDKEYNIKEYGEINKIYINNKKIVIDYEDFILEIDELGLNKIDKVKEVKDTKVIKKQKLSKEKELELDKYTTEELIDYLCYKRFLEFVKTKINDTEINEHLNYIKESVIKKLIK